MVAEGLVLDPTGTPLNLGNGGSLQLAALVIPPARRMPQWVANGDSDGAQLVRAPFYGPRDQCSMQVRVSALSMDAAMTALGVLELKLQEAVIRAAGGGKGLPFLWTPAGATTGLSGCMLLAEITDMPVTVDDAWFDHRPVVTVAFTCKPFLYGQETSITAATSTNPLLTFTVPSVPGDVAAEARLVITDLSSQARRHVEWGLECVGYNAGTPAALVIDSTALVTSGFAGSGTALSGAYGGSAITATLLPQPVAVCGTGSQPHVGTFRVKARVWSTSVAEYWRISWQDGDGSFASNDYAQAVAGSAFNELDLGVISIEEAEAGAQSWSGRIEAFTTTPDGEVGEVDYLSLFPCLEGYGLINADDSEIPGTVAIYDGFTGTTAGSVLNGRTAPIGGSAWATSGAGTDFKFSDNGFVSGSEEVTRNTHDGSLRFAVIGAARTDTDVRATLLRTGGATTDIIDTGLVARYIDANNYMVAAVPNGGTLFSVSTVVAGVGAEIAIDAQPYLGAAIYGMRLIVHASGAFEAFMLDVNENVLSALTGARSELATGGALQSGKAGLFDTSASGSAVRFYDNFYVATPPAQPVVINSGESLEIRSDSNQRQSADGTTYADIPSRGSRLFIPPAGDAARTTRIAVRATRNDPSSAADTPLGDNLQAQLFYRPRYLVVPRS